MARTTIMMQSTKTKNRNSRKNEKKRKSKKKRNTQTTKTKKRGITRRRIVGGADPASSSSSSSSSLKRPRSAAKKGEQKRRYEEHLRAAHYASLIHRLPRGINFDNTFGLQFERHNVTIGIADSTIESAGKGIFNAGDNVIPTNRKICEYKGVVYRAGTIPLKIKLL